MLTTLPERPEVPEEENRKPRRRARRSKGVGPYPTLAVGILGVCLGALLVLGAMALGKRLSPVLSVSTPRSTHSYGKDPEVNEAASSAYSLPRYEGDSSALTIAFVPHSDEAPTPQEVYQQVRGAVVSLTAYAQKSAAYGTGMILTSDGYVLTCAHVVAQNQSCTVTLSDGRDLEAQLVVMDEQTDLAVLKVEAQDLPTVQFADSDQVLIGDTVYAIGDPVRPDFRGTFTSGIISGLDRPVNGQFGAMSLMQITAPINSGNSGGPVLNAWGQVLGVVNMKISRPDLEVSIENMGMCIPSRTVKDVVEELVRSGHVQRTMLGISCQSVNEARAHLMGIPEGLWITNIDPASDVSNHDIQVGDLISAVNGTPVSNVPGFREVISGLGPGDSVTLTVWRDQALLDRLRELREAEDSSAASGASPSGAESFTYHFQELGEIQVTLVDSTALE